MGLNKPEKKLKKINVIEEEESMHLYFNPLTIGSLNHEPSTQAMAVTKIKNEPIACKIDSGAEGNVMTVTTYSKLFQDVEIVNSTTKILAYGGIAIKNYGQCSMTITHEGKENPLATVQNIVPAYTSGLTSKIAHEVLVSWQLNRDSWAGPACRLHCLGLAHRAAADGEVVPGETPAQGGMGPGEDRSVPY